jgi:DNA-binding CsgD family transcriptional regulator
MAGLVDAVGHAAAEALGLDELNQAVIPLLEKAFGAHLTAVVQFDETGMPRFRAGNIVRCDPAVYFQHYFRDDPVTVTNMRVNPRIFIDEKHVDRHAFEASEAYADYYKSRDIARVLACRIGCESYYAPGSVILGLFRSRAQPAFTPREAGMMTRLMPSLEAAARRSRRLSEKLRAATVFEALLDGEPRIVFDLGGRVVWMSASAEMLTGGRVAATLVAAARRLAGGQALDAQTLCVPLGRDRQAQLHVARGTDDTRWVVADLVTIETQLTRSERAVLDEMCAGRKNGEIAERLHVSLSTVKTHVHRILQKLGVTSRVQAVLIAKKAGR